MNVLLLWELSRAVVLKRYSSTGLAELSSTFL
jgi:hypothetical protein